MSGELQDVGTPAATPQADQPIAEAAPVDMGGEQPQENLDANGDVPSLGNVVSIPFYVPNGDKVELEVSEGSIVGHVKAEVFSRAMASCNLSEAEMPEYALKAKTRGYEGDPYLSEEKTWNETAFSQFCTSTNQKAIVALVHKDRDTEAARLRAEKDKESKLARLVGLVLSEGPEVQSFRKSMARIRNSIREGNMKTWGRYFISPAIPFALMDEENVPRCISSFKVKVNLPGGIMSKTITCTGEETCEEIIEPSLSKWKTQEVGQSKSAKDYLLKVPEYAEYLEHSKLLIHYAFVQEKLVAGQVVQVCLVDRASLELQPDAIADDPPEENVEADKVFKHNDMCIESNDLFDLTSLSLWDIDSPFRVQLLGVENLKAVSGASIFVSIDLVFGGTIIATTDRSAPRTYTHDLNPNPHWHQWMTLDIKTSGIPKGARLCVNLWQEDSTQKNPDDVLKPLGWVNVNLIDHKDHLVSGKQKYRLWPNAEANPIGTCVENLEGTCALYLKFDEYELPVTFPSGEDEVAEEHTFEEMELSSDEVKELEVIIARDPLLPLSTSDKDLLWTHRVYCRSKPQALAKVLLSLQWSDRKQVKEMHALMKQWAPLSHIEALELLDAKYSDEAVRQHAVNTLESVTSEELSDYLLQLVQALKYEPYHDSPLARFLMRKALLNTFMIGHTLFWHLKSETHVVEIRERYALLIQEYLKGCGQHKYDLMKQGDVVEKLNRIALLIKEYPDSERLEVLRTELARMELPKKFKMPLNPKFEASSLVIDKCKYMDSKKLPLWLKFTNADPFGKSLFVIFKSGDDLRQDLLTLQMLRIMDKLWSKAGLDLELTPYGCVATGDEQGMIEVVLNAETTAAITKQAGGATAAFNNKVLADWLRRENPSDEQYNKAVEWFIRSCSAYCVATYVLGIGDRHNDNIMCTRSGKLFHIDFGHFLGNMKKKFGINREPAPFVFTPDFAYVMGGTKNKKYQEFLAKCTDGYNVLRQQAILFINLFAMMLSTGIPELQTEEDISYLRTAFDLDSNDKEAAKHFVALTSKALSTWMTRLNNMAHILAH